MKKKYIRPGMTVVELATESMVMSMSTGNNGYIGIDPNTPGTPAAKGRRNSSGDMWDE